MRRHGVGLAASVMFALQVVGGGAIGFVGGGSADLGWFVAPAMASDEGLEELDKVLAEGQRLLDEGNLESLKQAIVQFEAALQLSQSTDAQDKQALSLLGLGQIYENLYEKQQALGFFNQALPLYRALGDRSGQAKALNGIGRVYSNFGEKKKALEFFEQSLAFSQMVGDRFSEAKALNGIGQVHNYLGDKERALEVHQQALSLKREVGDRSEEAITLNNIGSVYRNGTDVKGREKASRAGIGEDQGLEAPTNVPPL